jgi:hypothetical protein
MNFRTGVALATLLGGMACQTMPVAGEADRPATQNSPPALTMNAFYFGRVTSHWRIEADGSGEIWREPQSATGPGGPLEKYRGHLAPEYRIAFLREAARFRSGTIRRPPCRGAVHDAPSIDLRWGTGSAEHVDFYYGCRDAASASYGDRVGALSAIVASHFVREASPYAVEPVDAAPAY